MKKKDVLDELTDEERQEIRKDKTWAEGKVFIYKKEVHNYVSEEGLKLTDKKDLDLDNPAHFSQKKIKAIRRFDRSSEGKRQAQEIDKKREELLREDIDYTAYHVEVRDPAKKITIYI